MTAAPYVELHFDPTGFKPEAIPRAGAFLGTPAEALEAALAVTRAEVVKRAQLEIASIGVPTESQFLRIMDLAWQATFWRYRKVSAPIIADAYLSAYRAANAGDVPSSVIYALADQHTEKTGEYFYTSSREALSEGFNTLVNRRVPAKAAADRVTEGFGLTPRQMRAYTAASKFDTPVSSTEPRSLKARARAYVEKAFRGRVRKLAQQEEHNIDEQAKQFAWMWLQDKGRLNQRAQKLWITARDERVCPTCGPLHGVKIGINEQFKTTEGEFWTPGLHPNCRCVVRLIENRFTKNLTGVALADFNEEHPRGQGGRFGVKTRTQVKTDEDFAQIVGPSALARTDQETKDLFEQIVSVIPPSGVAVTRKPTSRKPVGVSVQPVTAPPETTTSAGKPKGVSARPKGVSARPRAVAVTRPRGVSARPKADVVPHTDLDVLRAELKTWTQAQAKAETPPPDTETVATRRGTAGGTADPKAWVVVTESSTSGKYQLNDKQVMDKKDAYAQVDAIIQSDVDEIVEHLGRSVVFQDQDGREWVVAEDDLRDLVEAHARKAAFGSTPHTRTTKLPDIRATELDENGDAVLDENGQPWTQKFGGTWAGRRLDLDKIPYETPKLLGIDKEKLTEFEWDAVFEVDQNTGVRHTSGNKYNVQVLNANPIGPDTRDSGRHKKRPD